MADENKNETKAAPAVQGPFTAKASPASAHVQGRVDQELRHPPTPRVRQDEPMHPYGLD